MNTEGTHLWKWLHCHYMIQYVWKQCPDVLAGLDRPHEIPAPLLPSSGLWMCLWCWLHSCFFFHSSLSYLCHEFWHRLPLWLTLVPHFPQFCRNQTSQTPPPLLCAAERPVCKVAVFPDLSSRHLCRPYHAGSWWCFLPMSIPGRGWDSH